jgi:hypothetical protein
MPDDEFVAERFDASEDFQSEADVSAPEYAAEGIYHVVIQSVDSSGRNSPGAVFLVLEILTGNVTNQEGKELRLPIWPPHPNAKDEERAKKRWKKAILRLMLAVGLRKEGEFPSFEMNSLWWDALEGKQLMARVTHQKKKQTTDGGVEKEWINAVIDGFDDLLPIGGSETRDVPVDQAALVAGGYTIDGATEI